MQNQDIIIVLVGLLMILVQAGGNYLYAKADFNKPQRAVRGVIF